MTPTLRDIPAVRAEAERRARVRRDALAGRWPSMEECPPPTWAVMAPAEREYLIDVELDLLADLTRPASRDAVARLVAERLGIRCDSTAPTFKRSDRAGMTSNDPTVGAFWVMWSDYSEAQWHDFDDWPPGRRRFRLAKIGTITDPATALTLIAIAVLTPEGPQ